MSSTEEPLSVQPTPTGQQSAQDSAELAFQPGYFLPHEQADPIEGPQATYVDYTDDPIGHVDWREERSENNKEVAAQAASGS
jgi:hypothetical protein